VVAPVSRFSALVLAGRRAGDDPLARSRGVTHKALVPVAGEPMLDRVLRTLDRAGARRVAVSIDAPALVEALPAAAALRAAGRLDVLRSAASPSRSVADALARASLPLLVTTADHPLLAPEAVEHFAREALAAPADVAVGLVREAVYRSRFAEGRRTWIRLRDGRVTGANLFAFLGPDAARAVAFWERAERHRKRPWRLVAAFGPLTLALFALGRLDLAGALARASRVLGARVAAVALPFPACAVDVDRAEDLALAEAVLASGRREAGAGP
jgi:GTP:adenosylcobinamide-phosphate guanylyltransferase